MDHMKALNPHNEDFLGDFDEIFCLAEVGEFLSEMWSTFVAH